MILDTQLILSKASKDLIQAIGGFDMESRKLLNEGQENFNVVGRYS